MRRLSSFIGWLKALTMLAPSLLAVLLTIPFLSQPALATGGTERIAYYGSWDMYGHNYYLKDVDKSGAASRLTTLVYSFENVHPTNLSCFEDVHSVDNSATSESNPNAGDGGADAWADYQRPMTADTSIDGQPDSITQALKGNFNQLKKLKARHPNLKILLSIGGWTFSKYFSDAAATPSSRSAFVSSCIDMFIKGNLPVGVAGDVTSGGAGVGAHIFDGIDIDWEFPGSANGHVGNHYSAADTANYTALLAEFRSQLNAQGAIDSKHYYLTAAVPSGGSDIAKIQTTSILSYLDWAGIMSYDMHGGWENHTNFNAPLYPSPNDPDANTGFTVSEAVQRWENAGWPAGKLTMGVPFYWRGWTGVGTGSNNGLYQPATGPSGAFQASSEPGTALFNELLYGGQMFNTKYDSITQSPWIYDGSNFYTGDTPQSMAIKGNYIRNSNLLGAMVYSLEGDDTSGTMLKSLTSGLNGGASVPLPSRATVAQMARTAASSKNTATNAEPINMIGGNFLLSRHEFNLPSKDAPVDFSVSYNSAAASEPSSTGYGWNHSYRVAAIQQDDGTVVVQNPDGRTDLYTPNGSGGYTPPQGIFDTLSVVGTTFKVVHKDRSTYTFNTNGMLATLTSANGNTQTLTYNATSQLTTITDSAGRNLTLAYNSDGFISTVTDPASHIISYSYDPLGNLVQVTNQAGEITKYAYDSDHHITKVTDPRGNDVVVNVYDTQGRVTKQTDGLGNFVTLDYSVPNQTTFTDAMGGQVVYGYDTQLRLTSQKDPLNHTTSITYDANGNVATVTDPLSHVTTRTYDTRGNLTQITDAAGGHQNFTYDSSDNLLTRSDQLTHTTTYIYDTHGNVLTYKDALNNTSTLTYDTSGQLTAVNDPLSDTTGFVYDANGNQVTTTDASNRNTYYGYDSIGRLTAVENMDLNETDYTLDAMGRVTKATDPSGHDTLVQYDLDGNRTKLTDANNHVTNFEYDNANHLTKTTDALGNATTYTYDANSRLAKKTDAKGRQTLYTYDAAGHPTQTTDPLSNVTKLTYDAAGNVATRVDASNRTTSYSYDNLNRLVTTAYPDSTTITNTYDAAGNLLTAVSPAGTTTYTYDANNRILTAKDPHNATITYTYNTNGSLTQVKYPDNKTVTYTYTPSGQLSTAKDWNNAQTTYLYDNEGRLATKTLPNTIKGTYAYDANGNLSNLTYKKGTAALTKYDYTRDLVGNITEEDETKASGTHSYNDYTYDADDQVTMNDAPTHTYNYTYDEVGSMKTSALDGTTSNYTYDNGNQLTTKASRAFTYDPQGNQITDGTKSLTYNYDNQLKTYTSGSTTTGYVYDATGQRIEKNGATNYQYVNSGDRDSAQVLVTKNTTAGTSNFNVYGADMISQGDTSSSSRQYYLTDGLGNVRFLTNSSGTTLNSYSYDPYGTPTVSGSTTNPFTFQNEQKDAESSLTFLRNRYYDATTGRFTSQDPLGGTFTNPATQNGYNYADNDPVNANDPSGKQSLFGFSPMIVAPTSYQPNPAMTKFLADYTGITDIKNAAANCNWGSLAANTGLALASLIGDVDGAGEAIGAARIAKLAKAEQAAANVTFKSDHVTKHLIQGISQEAMEKSIQTDLVKNPLINQYEVRQIQMDDKTLEYRAYQLPNGGINVGT